MSQSSLAAIVLAAGKGQRMLSETPKALHPIAGKPSLLHVLDAVSGLKPERTIVVVGSDSEEARNVLKMAPLAVEVAVQPEPKGTADATEIAFQALGAFEGNVIVLCADTPLLSAERLEATCKRLGDSDGPGIIVLAFRAQDPSGFGRLRTRQGNAVEAIVEERDASPEEQAKNLCNSGVFAADAQLLSSLVRRVGSDNESSERYLTDTIGLATSDGISCTWTEGPEHELLGVNTRAELAKAEAIMQERLRVRAMEGGAMLLDPSSVWLSHDTRLAADVRVDPHVFFGPRVDVEKGAQILSFCHIEGAHIAAGARIGPFARIRPGSVIGEGARVGNFVETKNVEVGQRAKANHLSYLGDGIVGDNANIGAGTIFCNFDGVAKHRTEVGKGAFVGSNTALIAPVTVGQNAVIGAGSTISKDVPGDALAVSRSPFRQVANWAKRRGKK